MLNIRPEDMDQETAALVLAALPGSAQELVRLIGVYSTLALIAEYGGTEFSFPRLDTGPAAALHARLCEIIGPVHTKLLAECVFSGERSYIPRAAAAMAVIRNRKIIADYCDLIKTISCRRASNALALKYRVCHRVIEKVVNGPSCSRGEGRP